ncbi:MAG TPA: hypothetical protein VN680_19275 [Burkholderiaceae bacterium]|nr:hypothetical protein [Burkholderiaceae bacterium]
MRLAGIDNVVTPYMRNLERLRPWLPRGEYAVLRGSREHDQIVASMLDRIDAMPRSYETDGQGGAALVVLHYFNPGCDWYITEKDVGGVGTMQAFGWAILNGDTECAELGYISIAELVRFGCELDLHWRERPLAEVIRERGGRALED